MKKRVVISQSSVTAGQLEDFFRKIKIGEIDQDNLQAFLENPKKFLKSKEAEIAGVPTPVFSCDMRKGGWAFLEHATRRITFTSDSELVSFLKPGENRIRGEEMVRRARQELNANFSQEDAEWLLELQDEIPKEWRRYCVVFTGTVWQDSVGGRRVPCLYWRGGRWCLGFYWLGCDWGSGDCLLRFSK